VVRALLHGFGMFVPLRDALSPLPDRPVRWLAIAMAATTAIVLAGATYTLATADPCRRTHARTAVVYTSTVDVARVGAIDAARAFMVDAARADALDATRAYALEAYPAWVAANPTRECPARLAELNTYVGRADTLDPWGTTYQFLCGHQHGVVGLRVRSAGPDRQFDTGDDIGSH